MDALPARPGDDVPGVVEGQPSRDVGTPVPARLKVRPDFLRAASGGRVHSRSLSLQVYRRRAGDASPEAGARVGLTVTKKAGNAVERNRIKRRFREALRAPGLAALPDHDYVIVARRDALAAPFAALVGEVRRCLADAAKGRDAGKGRARGASGPRHKPGAGRGGEAGSSVPHP